MSLAADTLTSMGGLPRFYDPTQAGSWSYRPSMERLQAEAARWRALLGPQGEAGPRPGTVLLLIDLQRDFCHPDGALYVGGRSGRGAIEDNDRIARFLYQNLQAVDELVLTLDTHVPFQIFFPEFWVDRDGVGLAAHQTIRTAQIQQGEVRPHPAVAAQWGRSEAWMREEVAHYCAELERAGRYELYLWPPHCLLGGEGHLLSGVIEEARLFHAMVRERPGQLVLKGQDPRTEHYSVFAPEVGRDHTGSPIGTVERDLLLRLRQADRIIVAGQASSHCVRASVEHLLADLERQGPDRARRVYLLEDCMSAVTVPDAARPGELLVDFTPQTQEALGAFTRRGVHVVRSTTPMADWPT